MAFKVDFRDEGLWGSRVIAADSFNAEAVWVTFFVEGGRLVAAVPTNAVLAVVKVDD